MKLKAYIVSVKNSTALNDTEIVHAETRGKALSQSNLHKHGYTFLRLRARRVPEMDGKVVSDRQMLESGYEWVICKREGCVNQISLGDIESGKAYYGKGDQAYCEGEHVYASLLSSERK